MSELVLNEVKREQIQSRLNHYLKRCRRHSEMTQREMAEHLGYSLSAYRLFECSPETDNRVINAFEILKQMADLEGMEPGEYVRYLDKGSSIDSSGANGLRRWEKELLSVLKRVNQKVRRDWSEAVMDCTKDQLSTCLKAMTSLTEIGPSELGAIKLLCESLVKDH